MTEKKSELLGVKYITTKDKFLTDTGVMFTHDEVRGMPHDQLQREYEKRLNGTLYDYAFLKSTGHIRRHKNMEEIRASAIGKVKDDHRRPVEMAAMVSRQWSSSGAAVIALRVIMGIVGVFAVFLSANYTTDFLLTSNKPSVAFVLSWAMIIFSVAAFDLIIYFWSRHKNWALSAVFGVLWVVVVAFSMFSTMEVNFRGYRALEKASVDEFDSTNSARLKIDLARDSVTRLQEEMRAKSEAYTRYAQQTTVSAWYLTELQKGLDATSKKLDEETKKLESLFEEFSVASISTATREKTFYDVFEELFSIEAGRVHFFVHMLPAVFIDIIAPFSIAVALFLGGLNGTQKRREEYREPKEASETANDELT
jgi:hypothetical protein